MSIVQSLQRALRLVAAVAMAAGALVASSLPADANPNESPSESGAVEQVEDVAPLDLAPTCFGIDHRSEFPSRYTDVQNNCRYTYRVKVIIAFGFDGPCWHMVPGERATHSYGYAGRFDRLELC